MKDVQSLKTLRLVSVTGMQEVDELLGDFGDDFNILDFVAGQDRKNAKRINILDDLEVERPRKSQGLQKLFRGLLQVRG